MHKRNSINEAPFEKPYGISNGALLVPKMGLEPIRYRYQQILSLPRLPVPPRQHIYKAHFTVKLFTKQFLN